MPGVSRYPSWLLTVYTAPLYTLLIIYNNLLLLSSIMQMFIALCRIIIIHMIDSILFPIRVLLSIGL